MSERQPFAGRLADICAKSSIALAACLAFAVPFGPSRNTDMQGLLLLIVGGLAWISLLLKWHGWPLDRPATILLGLFFGIGGISSIVNPHLTYDLLGAPHIRLGYLGLLSCLGFALLLQRTALLNILRFLYALILAIALISLPYVLWHDHSVTRIGGLFSQADIFGVCLAVGLILSSYVHWQTTRRRYTLFVVAQVYLSVLLILTGTRAAIFLCAILYPVSLRLGSRVSYTKLLLGSGLAVALLILSQSILPGRVTDAHYATESVSYRIALHQNALSESTDKPLLGYGPGNIADALDCQHLTAPALQKTCHQGFFFNSSHNIFLDRVLSAGWLGGVSFLCFVIYALRIGFRGQPVLRVTATAALLITLYYLTNVTSVILELLFWVLLMQCLRPSRASASR
ncbi:MAG TPA: O-antigen ligase family protein [Candidatus Saccharimonadales bacterium]